MSDDAAAAPQETVLHVCASCRPADHDDALPRPGAVLAARLAAAAETGAAPVSVKAVQCLSVCKRPCTVAISGADKFTYVVADADETHIDDLMAFANAHHASADGVTPWRERPDIVRKSVVARIPAPSQLSSLVTDPDPELAGV